MTPSSLFSDIPHRRYNPLTGEWVLVSPHRAKRPWQGQVEETGQDLRPSHDPSCYLCPGNQRANGERNPTYEGTFVFENDYAAMLPRGEEVTFGPDPLFKASSESGICRVICFSPRHDLTLSLMDTEAIRGVVDTWAEQYTEIGSRPEIDYVQIFENRGELMGCSNPHPHGQVWSNQTIPDLPRKEDQRQRTHLKERGKSLLEEYVWRELDLGERVVFQNEHFVCVVPFWAIWPFETLLVPKESVPDVASLDEGARNDLADSLRRMGTRFDNLFKTSFPYSMGLHQRPTDGQPHDHWCFHIHYFPPLLRNATVKKFMVGYEMLAMPQRDITAEESAERLRECSELHYSFEPSTRA